VPSEKRRSWKATRSSIRPTWNGTRTVMLIAPIGQQLDDALDEHRPGRPGALDRRQAERLRAVEQKLPRGALAVAHRELGHRLPEHARDGLADHLVGDAKAYM
jgi:hypothetical protein